jgi:hypothetical protein
MPILLSPGIAVSPWDYATPYVYKATNKITGEYYFGYRYHNTKLKTPRKIKDDLGVKYFTSCKQIKSAKDQFTFDLLLVADTPENAYYYEQELIGKHWNDPLLLNKFRHNVQNSKNIFRCTGHSDDTRKKISNSTLGSKKSDTTKMKMKQAASKRDSTHYDCHRGKKTVTHKWYCNGELEIQVFPGDIVPEGYNRGRLPQKQKCNMGSKGFMWFTSPDGSTSKQFRPEEAPDNWTKGRIVKHMKSTWKPRYGAANSSSKSVTIDGISYASIREAVKETGLSKYKIKKLYLNKE